MNLSTLTSTSHTVLGMVSIGGPVSSYQLKKMIDDSVGYFWPFPRAQLYVELERLESVGLLSSTQEEGGRRRRLYSITAEGTETLRSWIRADDDEPPQYRDPGLLKLFFASAVDKDDVVRLAEQRIAVHTRLLGEYQAIQQHLRQYEEWSFALATLRAGELTSGAAVTYWNEIINNPPEGDGLGARARFKSGSGS